MIDNLLEKYFDYNHPLWHEFQHRNVNIDTMLIWESGAGGNFIQSLYPNPPTEIYSSKLNEYKTLPECSGKPNPQLIWLRLDWLIREELSTEISYSEGDAVWRDYRIRSPRIPFMLGRVGAIDRLYESTKQIFLREGNFYDAQKPTYAASHDLPYILDNVCNFKTNNMISIISNTTTAWITWWLTNIKNEFGLDLFTDSSKTHRLFKKVQELEKSKYWMIDDYINGWFISNRPVDFIEPNSTSYFEMLLFAMNNSDTLEDFDMKKFLIEKRFDDRFNYVHYDFNNDYTQYCQEYFNDVVKNFVLIDYEDLFFKLDLSKLSFLNLDKNKIRDYSLRNIKLLKALCESLAINDKLFQLLDYEKFLNSKN
jgi:hypothetical protein